MVFSRFIWSILAFVAIIVGSSVLLGIYIQKPEYPVTISLLVAALVVETIAMVIFLTRIRRDLLKLINAIHKGFNALIKDFRLVRLDREAEQRFFEETVNHVQFGLLAFNGQGEVKMSNQAFLDLMGLKNLDRLEELEAISEGIPEFLRDFSPGRETLKKMDLGGQSQHLIFLSSGFVLLGEEITLVSVRDISREMDQNELEAWQKLLRVLRHEILNSISPIKLIAGNLAERLQPKGKLLALEQLKKDEIEEIRTGLETIHRRASGLSVFLDAYTNLYRTPEFRPEQTALLPLLQRIAGLFSEQAEQQKTIMDLNCTDPNIQVMLDPGMIEQVLINLVKNALEAVKTQTTRSITLSVAKTKKGVEISVEDTGTGIPRDQMESIFMPFFSTKETGTGVGLSFSQHVMRLHQGFIRVSSTPEEGSLFQLVFGNR